MIAGIYEGIRNGEADDPSRFDEAAGRDHVDWRSDFGELADQRTHT